jgi:saccharopine dehydrogenase-like NADP-dependent oxidoreductase
VDIREKQICQMPRSRSRVLEEELRRDFRKRGDKCEKGVINRGWGQGDSCASILARDKDVSEVVLGDIDMDLANKARNKIRSDKVTAVKLDAGKVEDIKNAGRGADVIINLTLIQFDANVIQAAVENGAHYVDNANGDPVWTQLMKGQPDG